MQSASLAEEAEAEPQASEPVQELQQKQVEAAELPSAIQQVHPSSPGQSLASKDSQVAELSGRCYPAPLPELLPGPGPVHSNSCILQRLRPQSKQGPLLLVLYTLA